MPFLWFPFRSSQPSAPIPAMSHGPDLLRRVDHKLDLLMREMGIGLSGSNRMPKDIQSLIASGNKIEAIKVYREQTGVSLREAKSVIDGEAQPIHGIEAKLDLILKELGIEDKEATLDRRHSPDLDSELEMMIRSGQLIPAIKRYRTLHGTDLKESKEAVEELQRRLLGR